MRLVNKLRHFIFFALLSAMVLSLFGYSFFGNELSIEEMQTLSHSLGIWLPVIFIAFYAIASVFIPITPLMAIAGIIFGFKYGMLYVSIGGLISAFITFYAARILGRDIVETFLHKRFLRAVEKYDEKIEERGIATVTILRITPIMPFNILNFLLGISRVRGRDYIIGTILGLIPSNLITVYFGNLVFKYIDVRLIAAFLAAAIITTTLWAIYKNR